MYVNTDTMLVEDYFQDTKKFVENYKKMSTPVPVQKKVFDLVTYVQRIMS